MKVKKNHLALFAAFLLVGSLLAGCSSGKEAGNSSRSSASEANEGKVSDLYELGKEPIEYSFYAHYDWYTMPAWGNDPVSKWIQDNKRVTIKAIHSGGNAKQKLNTMIATNELPDVIWMNRDADVEKLRQAGMLVAFDDYLEKYPNLKKWLGDEGANMLRSEDGKLYQFPNWYTSQPNGNAGYVVNKKIYDELGKPKLETTDDLYNYLKAVKAKYPDVTPYEPGLAKDGQGIDVLYSAFKENDHKNPGMRAVPNGDKMTSIFTDPEFRESSLFTANLFREKLITQDAYTQTQDQIKEKVLNGKVAIFAGASPTDIALLAQTELAKKDPNAGYFMVMPIYKEGLDKNKIFPGTFTRLGWNVSVITKSAKNPEAIFAFLDWYTGPEGQSTVMWGPSGQYWDGFEPDGFTPKFTEKYTSEASELAKLQAKVGDLNWVGNTVFVDRSKANYESALPAEKQNWSTYWQREVTWKTQSDATEFINMDPMPDSEEGIINQRVEDIWLLARVKSLFAKTDEEVLSVLDKAEKDANAAGYEKLLAFKTQKWKENLKKMQGK